MKKEMLDGIATLVLLFGGIFMFFYIDMIREYYDTFLGGSVSRTPPSVKFNPYLFFLILILLIAAGAIKLSLLKHIN